nr:hypothetical protein [uncultured Mediterranean phage uvMED]
MAYIGTKPTAGNFQICDAISVVNGQAAYTMQVGGVNVSPQSASHMIVSLNGTIQKPNSSFTVSGSTITFASNLATGDVIDFIQILGDVLDLGVPSDATVTTAKLADSSVSLAKLTATGTKDATTFLRGDNTFQTISSDFVRISTSTVGSAHDYINFDNVFSSSYDNYLVVGRINNTYGATNIGVRFRASGSTETGNNYNRYGTRLTSSSYNNSTSQSYMAMYNNDDVNDDIAFYFYVHTPFDSSHSGHIMGSMTSRAGIGMYFAGNVRNTTSYDGISIFNVNTSAGDLNNSKTTIYGLTNA